MSRVAFAMRATAVAVIVVAAALAIARWAILPLQCAHMTWRSMRQLDAEETKGQPELQRLAAQVQTSVGGCTCPADHELVFVAAGAAAIGGDARGAIAGYRRALTIDRRPETYFELGMTELESLDRRAAIDDLARACAFDPARLAQIPYDDVRRDTEARIRDTYGDDWLR